VAGSYEYDDEPSGLCPTDLVNKRILVVQICNASEQWFCIALFIRKY
jgi:hypothetical protein